MMSSDVKHMEIPGLQDFPIFRDFDGAFTISIEFITDIDERRRPRGILVKGKSLSIIHIRDHKVNIKCDSIWKLKVAEGKRSTDPTQWKDKVHLVLFIQFSFYLFNIFCCHFIVWYNFRLKILRWIDGRQNIE